MREGEAERDVRRKIIYKETVTVRKRRRGRKGAGRSVHPLRLVLVLVEGSHVTPIVAG